MRTTLKCFLLLSLTGVAYGTSTDTKTETKHAPKVEVHRTEKKIEKTININTNAEKKLIKDSKNFCGETKEESEKKCKDWIKENKASLKGDLRTSHCSDAHFLYGKEEGGCSKYVSTGEISYLLK